MKIEQIYTGCLAEAAYYIESEGEAIIIDPLRETKPYLEMLSKNKASLKYILETHFHADFVSGHVDLAKQTGATIVYGPNAEANFDFHVATDGEELKLGNIIIKVLHTPGHTPESSTYLLIDENGNEHCIFSGDTLFIGDVGRPDLAVKSDLSQEDLAGMLYDSMQSKILPLADDVIVYPGHGAGSACGKNLSTDTWDTLGNQRKTNYALQAKSKDEFVNAVLDGLTPPPQYFPKNVMLNKQGYDSFSEVVEKGMRPINANELESVVEATDALILDTRSPEEFANGFIPKSVFIGIDGSFASWVGTLIVDLKQPIILVADETRIEEVVTRLSRVGYDNCIGYLEGGFEAWKNTNNQIDTVDCIAPNALKNKAETEQNAVIVDARKPSEFDAEHVKGAINLPLDYVNQNMDKFESTNQYYIHCKSGYRSMVNASILKARGINNIVNVNGGFQELSKTDIAITEFECQNS